MRLNSHRLAAAFGLLLLAAPAASAQDTGNSAVPATTNSTVGSPLLRDFDLSGKKTTPPAPVQQPTTTATAPATTAGTQPSAQPARTAPARTVPARAAPTAAPAISDYLKPKAEAPLPVPTDTAVPEQAPLPQGAPALPQPAAQPSAWPAYYWGAPAALLVLLLGFFLFQRSRRNEALAAEAPMARSGFPEPAPRPAAKPVPAAPVDEDIRPWLELDFKPEKMVATATEATVHFDLTVTNVGKSAARNVRIHARMFNPSADQQQDIKAFFAMPLESHAPMEIPSQFAAKFRTLALMPRDKVREINVQGMPLFIPTVAVNIVYEWGDGCTGQTSKSYLIGTEKQEAEKMGPFRLDLGPRIYRQVGGRPLELARAV